MGMLIMELVILNKITCFRLRQLAAASFSFESDVDIIVEFFELQEYLEDVLQREVDLVTEKALKPQIEEVILNEVKYAFF